MTEKFEIYKCKVCGNCVQVLLNGVGELVCCGEKMELQNPKHDLTEIGEKHLPKIEHTESKRLVTVKNHPMIKEHFIQFIEVYTKNKEELYLKYFKPEDEACADITFMKDKEVVTLENCNLHGLWRGNEE